MSEGVSEGMCVQVVHDHLKTQTQLQAISEGRKEWVSEGVSKGMCVQVVHDHLKSQTHNFKQSVKEGRSEGRNVCSSGA